MMQLLVTHRVIYALVLILGGIEAHDIDICQEVLESIHEMEDRLNSKLDREFTHSKTHMLGMTEMLSQILVNLQTGGWVPGTTHVPETTTQLQCTQDSDAFEYEGKCFWLIAKDSGPTRSYHLTKTWCQEQGGDVGNVYSEEHYKMVEKVARAKIKGSNIYFWTDMTYDLETKQVFLGNSQTAPYVTWYSSSYPTTNAGHDAIKIQFDSSNHGYYNRPRSENSKGVLCETEPITKRKCGQDEKAFEYNGKCFWLIMKDSGPTRSYDLTKTWCQDQGGDVGNIYSEEHYEMVEKVARGKMKGSNIYFWTDMTYDLETEHVFLGTSLKAPYVRWYSSRYPTTKTGHDAIKIQFNSDPKDENHGYYNRPRSENSKGVLCEA